MREEKIYYGRQWIDEEDIRAVSEVLNGPYITCGPMVEETERQLSDYTGAQYTVLVNSGTSALHCACIAAGIKDGDEVIVSPLTFAASANCILYCGGKPVFVDIDIETYNIDPEKIEEKITSKTKAIIAVDFAGQAVRIDEIKEICIKHNLVFIEDAAHSIGTKYKDKYVGSLADMTCFSFHPVKTITCGEGGAIQTNNPSLFRKLMLARSHGITRENDELQEKQPEGIWYYEQISLGYNYRMTDFQAALLSSQLKKIESFKKRRGEIVEIYDDAFGDIPELTIQKELPESDTCRHIYTIRLNLEKLKCTRRDFFDALSSENVQPQVHYIPVYWFPYYQSLGYKRGLCPNAEYVYERIMSIPLYPRMKDQDIFDVEETILNAIEKYKR